MRYIFYNRRSIRLPKHNYAMSGKYFVTICTQNRECLFGDVINNAMKLNAAGEMIQKIWCEIPEYYFGIDVDIFQIMPNHIHGIIVIKSNNNILAPVGADPCVCPCNNVPPKLGQTQGSAPTYNLSEIVQRFKSLTTIQYIVGIKQHGWVPFNKRFGITKNSTIY